MSLTTPTTSTNTPNNTTYIITNPQQTKFLYQSPNSRIQSTTCRKFATAWNTYEKALNITKTLPSTLSSERWIPISSVSPPKPISMRAATSEEQNSINNYIDSISTVIVTNTSNTIDTINNTSTTNTPTTSDVVQYLKSLNERQSSLSDKLNKLDRETQDVLHYIEFTNLNAFQGYKIYKLLQDIRQERRETKDELAQVDTILSQLNISQFIRELPILTNRKYVPRELPDLFIEGI